MKKRAILVRVAAINLRPSIMMSFLYILPTVAPRLGSEYLRTLERRFTWWRIDKARDVRGGFR